MLLVIYVDDVLVISTSQDLVAHVINSVREKFTITPLGFPKWFLGIRISKDNSGVLLLDQSKAVMELLKRFDFNSLSPIQVPMSSKTHLQKIEDPSMQTSQPYRSLIGSLMYLMTSTRPDLAVPISKLAQFLALPSSTHWLAAKKVCRYLKGTADLGLSFKKDQGLNAGNLITAYSDSDWASDPSDRKSYSGFVIFLGSAVVSWKCKKQNAVALSSAEAEYMALALAVMEVVWLRQLLSNIGFPQTEPTTMFCDNLSAMHIGNTDVTSPKTKHISIKHHYIRTQIAAGVVTLEYVPTEHNIADVMTKPLEGKKFLGFRDLLQLRRTIGI